MDERITSMIPHYLLTFTVFHLSLTMLPYFKTVKLDYGDNLT